MFHQVKMASWDGRRPRGLSSYYLQIPSRFFPASITTPLHPLPQRIFTDMIHGLRILLYILLVSIHGRLQPRVVNATSQFIFSAVVLSLCAVRLHYTLNLEPYDPLNYGVQFYGK